MKKLDVRGLSCPEPIIQTQNFSKKEKEFEVLVDTTVSLENVKRFLETDGFSVKEKAVDDYFILQAKK